MNSAKDLGNSCSDFRDNFQRQWPTAGRRQVLGQMSEVAGADDRRVAVRMRERVSQDEFRSCHVVRTEFVELGFVPDFIERRSLDFRIRATLGDAAPQNDAAT